MDEDDEDDFYGGLDLDQIDRMVEQRSGGSGGAPPGGGWVPPSQQPTQRLTAPTQQQQAGSGWRAGGPAPGGAAAAAAAGPVCSHGVPYAACTHRQQHLDDITRQVADAAMQMADAEGPRLAALQQEVKRLRDLKQQLEAAPPPGQQQQGGCAAYGGAQQQYQQQPQYQQGQPPRQQQYQQGGGQVGVPPPQQQQRQWGGGQQYGGPPAPAGGFGGGAGSGYLAGPPAGSYQNPGMPAPSYQNQGGFGGGGGVGFGASYDQGPPPPPWEPDRAALQNVRAEREDATHDAKCVGVGGMLEAACPAGCSALRTRYPPICGTLNILPLLAFNVRAGGGSSLSGARSWYAITGTFSATRASA